MQHWALQYIGKPWSATPRAPLSFHCWVLVQWVQRNHYNRDCPDYDIVNPADQGLVAQAIRRARDSLKWVKLTKPVDGCITTMSNGKDDPHHVGVYLSVDGGGILHARSKHGVLFQKRTHLRALGVNVIDYYHHRSWLPTSS